MRGSADRMACLLLAAGFVGHEEACPHNLGNTRAFPVGMGCALGDACLLIPSTELAPFASVALCYSPLPLHRVPFR